MFFWLVYKSVNTSFERAAPKNVELYENKKIDYDVMVREYLFGTITCFFFLPLFS